VTWLLWGLVGITLAALELAGAGLVCLCLGIAALVVAGAAALGVHALATQLLLFSSGSVALVLSSRTLARRFLQHGPRARLLSGAAALPGEVATVIQPIDNGRNQGQVLLHGIEWTARSLDDAPIPENTRVRVIQVDGVKLIVDLESGGS
jgi:membrane protein implicated in regulation of membrane protease activity